jgi:hypothetical protein
MSRPPKTPPPRPPKPPPPPPPATKPRTFGEVVAVNLQEPFHAARLDRLDSGESFDGVSVHPLAKEAPTGSSSGPMATAAVTSPSLTGRWPSSRHATISAFSRAGQLKVQRHGTKAMRLTIVI